MEPGKRKNDKAGIVAVIGIYHYDHPKGTLAIYRPELHRSSSVSRP